MSILLSFDRPHPFSQGKGISWRRHNLHTSPSWGGPAEPKATLGWGRCSTPPGSSRFARLATLPINLPARSRSRFASAKAGGRDGVRCATTTDMRPHLRDAFKRPGFAQFNSPEGVARRKAQTYGSAILEGPRRAPLGAPERRLFGDGPRFRIGHRAQLGQPSFARRSGLREGGRPIAQHPNVSQLLAGSRNGPGRSPVAARVTCQRNKPRRHRTSSRLTTPHENAP